MRIQAAVPSGTRQGPLERFQRVVDDSVNLLGNLAVLAAIDIDGIGRRYFSSGHVDRERTISARPEHLYQIGSQSKTFVAICMLLLHRRRALNLDGSVRDYLDLPIDPRITLRHLVMNTSGLGESTFAFPAARLDPRVAFLPRDLVALALPQGQLFDPGSQFDYCNTGWVIAASIIESVCGRPYGQIIRETVCEPLRLHNTIFGGGAPQDRMLRGYLTSQATSGAIDISDCHHWAFGAGDGVSSLDDMLTFFGSLRAAENAIGVTIEDLCAVTAKPSKSPFFPLSIGTEYGLGIERRAWAGSEVWGHPGSTFAYLSGTWADSKHAVTVSTCVTREVTSPSTEASDIRYPRAQLFAMALNTAYALSNR